MNLNVNATSCLNSVVDNIKNMPMSVDDFASISNIKATCASLAFSQEPRVESIGNTDESKTKLVTTGTSIWAVVKEKYGLQGRYKLLPDIKDVQVIKQNGEPRVVKVFFMDNTFSRAVLNKNDVFSLESGISICLFKRSLHSDADISTSLYNKLIKHAIDVKKYNEKAEKEIAEAAAAEKKEKQKRAEEKKRRALAEKKKVEQEREEKIAIQVEAYKRLLAEGLLNVDSVKEIAEETNNEHNVQ